MSKRPYLLAGLATLVALMASLLVVPAFAAGPDGCDEVVAQGEYEEFGDGWSNHWTDGDNADGSEYT